MDEDFARELEARLVVMEAPEYVDPAREDLPTRDLVLLVLLSTVVVVLMVAWSYPA